jgi:hypothetical protein
MPAILLTEQNLKFAKSVLRERLSYVNSAHLTEALAASVYYKTNAALRAAVANPVSAWPRFAYFNAGKLNERLEELGYAPASEAIVAAVARSFEMPTKPWIELRDGDIPAINDWFHECSRWDVPLVYIETRRSLAKLTWDCITVQSKSIDAALEGESGNKLGGIMFRAFQHLAKSDSPRAEFLGKAFVGTIDGLRFGTARVIADAYCAILYAQLERAVFKHDSTMPPGKPN